MEDVLNMTTDEVIEEFYKMYPDAPNPDHYPKCFLYYVNMYSFHKKRLTNEQQTDMVDFTK